MKKSLIAIFIISILLSSCSKTSDSPLEDNTDVPSSNVQDDIKDNEQDTTEQDSEEPTDVQVDADFDYEQALIDYVGLDFLEGRAFIRADDDEILGQLCAVFQIGTNSPEKFTTEQWLAVDKNGMVYSYDIVLDEWSTFTVPDKLSLADCMYMLNEVVREEFATEYYDSADQTKQAVYESEDAYKDYHLPIMLIAENETVPDGYIADPADASYFSVYNFSSKAELKEHLSLYFTQNYIENIQRSIDENFLEFEGALYLVRGGRGYGSEGIDLDTVDYDDMQNNIVIVDLVSHGEVYSKGYVIFVEEDGINKIDSYYNVGMYSLFFESSDIETYAVAPDFFAFANRNEAYTADFDYIASDTIPNAYEMTYLGDYSDLLPKYITFLKQLDYEVIIDGHEGYYSLEQRQGDHIVTINAYFLNEEDGVRVEVGFSVANG